MYCTVAYGHRACCSVGQAQTTQVCSAGKRPRTSLHDEPLQQLAQFEQRLPSLLSNWSVTAERQQWHSTCKP